MIKASAATVCFSYTAILFRILKSPLNISVTIKFCSTFPLFHTYFYITLCIRLKYIFLKISWHFFWFYSLIKKVNFSLVARESGNDAKRRAFPITSFPDTPSLRSRIYSVLSFIYSFYFFIALNLGSWVYSLLNFERAQVKSSVSMLFQHINYFTFM